MDVTKKLPQNIISKNFFGSHVKLWPHKTSSGVSRI